MSSSKSTRLSKAKEENANNEISKTNNKINKSKALLKVFYIAETLLSDPNKNLLLERFYHPGKGELSFFITRDDTELMEVLQFSEPRRSWFIDNNICSNGRLYLTTPVDVMFFVLYHIRKHCTKHALSLDNIHDEENPSTMRLLSKFTLTENLSTIADVKVAGDMKFYKYNHEKSIAWLAIKAKRISQTLKETGTHCGRSATSQNYARSDKIQEESAQDIDYLRMACDIVGGYIEEALYDELKNYLEIPSEKLTKSKVEEKTVNKRKSQSDSSGKNKKFKLNQEDDVEANVDEASESQNDIQPEDLLEVNIEVLSPIKAKPIPLKERTITAKEKALAKSAKGTKSIASFFKKS